jgi:hypothetical protein
MATAKKRDGGAAEAMLRAATRGLGPCACDAMTMLFPEYHWPHCKKNPRRISGVKDKLGDEARVLQLVSVPSTTKPKKRKVKTGL